MILIFVDILLPDNRSGVEILRSVNERRLNCPVIMMTGAPNIETAAESVRLGAYDYLAKPVEKTALLRITSQALRHKLLRDEKSHIESENERYRQHLDAIFRSVFEGIITVNPVMQVMNVNNAAIQFLRLDPQQVVGRKLDELLDESYAACCTVLRNTLQSQTPVREYRVEFRPANRARQVVMLNSAPLVDHEQTFLGAVLVIRDITRLTNLERELKDTPWFSEYHWEKPANASDVQFAGSPDRDQNNGADQRRERRRERIGGRSAAL